MKRVDLTGNTYGRWTVLSYLGYDKYSRWLCRCTCNTERAVSYQNLVDGKSKSCGCLRVEVAPQRAIGRDLTGDRNPRAIRSKAINGSSYIPSNSVWYKRAAGIFHSAKKRGIAVGFSTAMELARYVISITPPVCPVFGQPFTERGKGFSRWSPSIDKIDPCLGYIPGNIQVISMLANCMKRDASPEELERFAHWVLDKK